MAKTRFPTIPVLLAAAAASFLPAFAPSAFGAKLDVTPSISLDQTYDSNVFNTNGNEKGDFILRATPAVTFSLKMPETTLNFRSSFSLDWYYKYTERNSSSSAFSLGIDATPIQLNPRLSVTPSGHFVQSRDSYVRNQLVPTGDPLVPYSIGSESATHKSRDFGGALGVNYLVTPKVDFSIGGGFTKRQFLDNVSGDIDSQVLTGDTSIGYKFTPNLSSGFFFNTAHNTFENGRDSRTYSGGLQGSYKWTPAVSLNARAGASRAQETGIAGAPDRTTWSPSGLLTLAYAEKDFNATFGVSIDQSGGGSFGFTTKRQSANLLLSDQFAARWWADLSGSYQENRSLDAAVTEDLTSATGTAAIRHQPWEWLAVHLSGTSFRQWSNGAIGTDLKRYSAFLGVTLSNTYNIY